MSPWTRPRPSRKRPGGAAGQSAGHRDPATPGSRLECLSRFQGFQGLRAKPPAIHRARRESGSRATVSESSRGNLKEADGHRSRLRRTSIASHLEAASWNLS